MRLARNNPAVTYLVTGRASEAESMLKQALAGLQMVLGMDHLSTTLTRENLAAATRRSREGRQ